MMLNRIDGNPQRDSSPETDDSIHEVVVLYLYSHGAPPSRLDFHVLPSSSFSISSIQITRVVFLCSFLFVVNTVI